MWHKPRLSLKCRVIFWLKYVAYARYTSVDFLCTSLGKDISLQLVEFYSHRRNIAIVQIMTIECLSSGFLLFFYAIMFFSSTSSV